MINLHTKFKVSSFMSRAKIWRPQNLEVGYVTLTML